MKSDDFGRVKQGFTPRQVVAIKQALIKGADVVAVARVYGCSAETVRRIKRGETYNHVVVVGEDKLRPRINWGEAATQVRYVEREAEVEVEFVEGEEKETTMMSAKEPDPDEMLASVQRMMKVQEEVNAKKL